LIITSVKGGRLEQVPREIFLCVLALSSTSSSSFHFFYGTHLLFLMRQFYN
jgi:hypothetical protein